jgi:hypothetical protein
MKTKSFLMIFCLFAGAALMSLSAQKTDRTVNTWEKALYRTWVACDGKNTILKERSPVFLVKLLR